MLFGNSGFSGAYEDEVADIHKRETPCTTTRAVAGNLLFDPRVDAKRGERYLSFVNSWRAARKIVIGTIPTALESLNQYTLEQQNVMSGPEFCDASRNPGNVQQGLNLQQNLLHVLNLSARFTETRRGLDIIGPAEELRLFETLEKFPRQLTNYPRWLEETMRNTSTRTRGIEAVLAALSAYHSQAPKKPIWVTIEEEFDGNVLSDADAWLAAVGMIPVQDHWVVILVYPAADVPQLVRPSVLESGTHYLHFPTPRDAKSGNVMSLKLPLATPPLREFIHPPIPLKSHYCQPPGGVLRCMKTKNGRTAKEPREPLCASGLAQGTLEKVVRGVQRS